MGANLDRIHGGYSKQREQFKRGCEVVGGEIDERYETTKGNRTILCNKGDSTVMLKEPNEDADHTTAKLRSGGKGSNRLGESIAESKIFHVKDITILEIDSEIKPSEMELKNKDWETIKLHEFGT